ncbi:MAG: hypothetical protein ACXW2G_10390 [Burkholderiaceae bacterium]
MDWGYKAMLTTVTVGLVLLAAQAFGRRLAGTLSGLPVIAAPALLWVGQDQGAAVAATTAIGSIVSCGLSAVFALTYEWLSRRLRPLLALTGSLFAGGVLAMPMTLVSERLVPALMLTLLLFGTVIHLLPRPGKRVGTPGRLRGQVLITAVTAGVVSVLVAHAAREVGPYWAGLLASLPIICAATLVHQHVTAMHLDLVSFLAGYVAGLFGKAVFALGFALLATGQGVVPALFVALVLGLVAATLATRGLKWIEQRHPALADV